MNPCPGDAQTGGGFGDEDKVVGVFVMEIAGYDGFRKATTG